MNKFIPIIVAPCPDEFLYSWVMRLANANKLSVPLFFETYFGKEYFSKFLLPIDIRKGFGSFYNFLNCTTPVSELYLSLSTLQFELLSYPPKMQTKFINPIFRKENNIYTIKEYLMTDFRMCKECMKEDKELFGETYIHRSHQLSGVCVCHKHHTPLFIQKRNSKYIYKDETLEQMELADTFEKECEYADYTHFLLENNFQSNSNDLMKIIIDKLGILESNKKELVIKINEILKNGKTYSKESLWSKNDYNFPIKDFIKVLMYAYPNPKDILVKAQKFSLIIEQKCDKCGKTFYTTEQALKDGWGCTFCDDKLKEVDLIKRLIKIGGNGEYVFKGFLPTKTKNNIRLFHKPCGEEHLTSLNNFVFNHKRCKCGIKMQRKEAEKEMKKHPQFKLVEFNGATLPAKFRHNDCGREFEYKSFRWFLKWPKCPHCQGFTKENLEQEIRDVVGDEYTVCDVGIVRKDKVTIRHNVCGCTHEYVPYNFLMGARCPKCYNQVSLRELKIMLKEYSDDRYEIVGKRKEKCIIYDKETDETIELTNRHILQEIKRPTPSPLLPVENHKTLQSPLSTWDFWYQLCIEYKNEFGHLYPAMNETYKGYNLYSWLIVTRQYYKKGKLSQEKIQALKDVGFVFDSALYKWEQLFNKYKTYVKETGNYFPSVKEVHNGYKVGEWYLRHRKLKNKGKLNPKYEKILLEYCPDFFKERKASRKKNPANN
ncbi:MAG: Helicase associated domain protein [Agathobacter sp.]|nr:Helicase associated domain protein [Agathobacter sp.]